MSTKDKNVPRISGNIGGSLYAANMTKASADQLNPVEP